MTLTLHHTLREQPGFWARAARMNWLMLIFLTTIAGVGAVMLYSVASGDAWRWAYPHLIKFAVGMVVLITVAMIDIRIWQRLALPIYCACVALLIATQFLSAGDNATDRWIELGALRLQPSEPMKVALVLLIASIYARKNAADPPSLWSHIAVLVAIGIPVVLVVNQPDLGTAALIFAGGITTMFLGGLQLWLLALGVLVATAGLAVVLRSEGTSWAILKPYQYERIDAFRNPEFDPLGAGYHIQQSQIALGSGGMRGAGFQQGPQGRLDFLPEKHTDFILSSLGEEFGFLGTIVVLALYVAVLLVAAYMLYRIRAQFSRVLTGGLACLFFLYFAVNIGMVSGLLPVVGVPLPLISHGGSAMLTVMVAFGLIQSAYIHEARAR